MNRNETIKLFTFLSQKYKGYFTSFSNDEKNKLVDEWTEAFKGYQYSDVYTAVTKHCERSKYFPFPREILTYLPAKRNSFQEQPESPKDLVDLYRQMLIDFQNEWKSTGELPSMKDYEIKYGIRTELRSDGHTELHWR